MGTCTKKTERISIQEASDSDRGTAGRSLAGLGEKPPHFRRLRV